MVLSLPRLASGVDVGEFVMEGAGFCGDSKLGSATMATNATASTKNPKMGSAFMGFLLSIVS